MIIGREEGIKAIYGGLFLGGGGGGNLKDGIEVLERVLELGDLKLYDIEEFCKEDIVLTASLVGSPASKYKYVGIEHYKRVYELYSRIYDHKISGIITNEMGAQSITNGWLLSAMTKIPLIDAACNGRAHPMGAMGSMGLSSDENYITMQTGAGGQGKRNTEVLTKGTIKSTSSIIRKASIEAGGFVTVLRNPVDIGYIKKNAAINSIKKAIEIGRIFVENIDKPDNIFQELSEEIDMEIICKGRVSKFQMETKDGFDLGTLNINASDKDYEIVFWNEYMTIENAKGIRIATFPDLIAILDKKTGLAITSAELEMGMEVILVYVPKDKVILGKSMFDMKLLSYAEKVVDKNLVEYF